MKCANLQSGASLIIGLILLLAISLLTLVNARSGLSQYQALQANQDYLHTFQAADSALNKSGQWLYTQILSDICQSQCSQLAGVITAENMPLELHRKSLLWWQSNAQAWQGGWRLMYLQSSQSILLLDEVSGSANRYQREIYSSYFFQQGTLPGNRVLLHDLWQFDRPYFDNTSLTINNCLPGSRLRAAMQNNLSNICGRLAWEQIRP